MEKYSFVINCDYINETILDLNDLNLTIIENESDLNLGYFTITGNKNDIKYFKDFLNGQYI